MNNKKNIGKNKITQFIPQIVIAVIALAVIITIIALLKNWDKNADTAASINLNEAIDPAALVESEDYYTYMDTGLLEAALSDGQLQMLFLGDESVGSFKSGDTIASHVSDGLLSKGIKSQSSSFAFPKIHYSPYYMQISPDVPDNFLSMYSIVESLCENDFTKQENVLKSADFMIDYNDENRESYKGLIDKLSSINMEEIDVIVISTGIWDYQTGVPIANLEDLAAPYTHSGAVNAAALMIMETFPRIRLIVMSPTYFRTDISGKEAGADTTSNGVGRIGDYMTADKYVAVDSNFSYLDNLFGTGITEQNYSKFLEKDLLFPNDEGRKIVADRIAAVLTKDFGDKTK